MLQHKFIEFSNPSLPPLHDDISSWANKVGLQPEAVVRHCLYGQGLYNMDFSVDKTGRKARVTVVPGHLWYHDKLRPACGPEPAEVMFIGKALSSDDVANRRCFTGDFGRVLLTAMQQAGFRSEQISKYYIANLLSTMYLDSGKSSPPKGWIDAQHMLIMQQLLIVKPKYCVLFGAEAIKAMLGTKYNLTSMVGQVVTKTYDVSEDGSGEMHEVHFMATTSPGAVMYEQSQPDADPKFRTTAEQKLVQQLRFVRSVIEEQKTDTFADKFSMVVIDDTETLERYLIKMRDQCENRLVAWDAEWHGEHPENAGSYIRCIQFAYRDDLGCVIALRHPGGAPRMRRKDADGEWTTDGAEQEVARLCKTYMRDLRVVGHYFAADLEWLIPFGLDLRAEYDAAKTYEEVLHSGGIATELAAHAWDECQLFGLDEQLILHTEIPPYSSPIKLSREKINEDIKAKYKPSQEQLAAASRELHKCHKRLAKASSGHLTRRNAASYKMLTRCRDAYVEAVGQYARVYEEGVEQAEARDYELAQADRGYGLIPDDVLYRYGALDAAAELALAKKLLTLLPNDRYGNDCRRAYWISHRAALVALEINCTGLRLNRKTLDEVALVFTKKQEELIAKLREKLNWPTFNPRSRFEFAEALFGDEFNGYLQQYGTRKRKRPPGAKTIRAIPLRTTGKSGKEWISVLESGKELTATVDTGKQTLGELFHMSKELPVRKQFPDGTWTVEIEDHSELISLLRDYRLVDQVLKSLIRSPKSDVTGNVITDDAGDAEYEEGVAKFVCDDGKVRGRVRQTLETARWAILSPNLQNLPNSRESDYLRILGNDVNVSPRSIFVPDDPEHDPLGEYWYFAEADYSGAELLVMALLSQDAIMIDHCIRNNLPEDHPDYFDIHSNTTVSAFRLNCEPTKAGLKSIGKAHLRTVGKCVAAGTWIHTTDGPKRIEDVCCDLDAGQARRDSTYRFVNYQSDTAQVAAYRGGLKKCLQLIGSDGSELICTPEHQILTLDEQGNLVFVLASEMQPGMVMLKRIAAGPFGTSRKMPDKQVDMSELWRPRHRQIDIPTEATLEWAAFLGLHLAEGCVTARTNVDGVFRAWSLMLGNEKGREFCQKTHELLVKLFGDRLATFEIKSDVCDDRIAFRVSSADLATWLSCNCGRLSKNLRIPEEVFNWDKELIAELLRWLFEGDGTAKSNGNASAVCYSTSSEQLAKDVQYLLSLFGIASSLQSETRNGHSGVYWNLRVCRESIDTFINDIGFISESKRAVSKRTGSYTVDRQVIPGQEARLRALLPFVRSNERKNRNTCPRSKLQECLRKNSPVRLNPSRLHLILGGIDISKLDKNALEAYQHLSKLSQMNVRWMTLREVRDAGEREVYDVQTTDEFDHVVTMGGYQTHNSIAFGLAYGRSANAIAIAVRQEGVNITVEEAQQAVDTYLGLYADLHQFLQNCKRRVSKPGWLATMFGRYRRFPYTKDQSRRAAFEREAMNAPIQGTVADAMSIAARNIYDVRNARQMRFRIALQIHDAIKLHVPASELVQVVDPVNGIFKRCMVDMVDLVPTDLDGNPMLAAETQHFGIEVKIYDAWGVKTSVERLLAGGIDPKDVGIKVNAA